LQLKNMLLIKNTYFTGTRKKWINKKLGLR
jgi:hypothetical protein